MADLLVLPRPAESLQNGADFSGKTCNTLGLPKRKEWPQCHKEQLARMPEPPLPKEKKQSHLSRSPDREEGESQDERELHLDQRERDQRGSMERKGGFHSEGR